MLVSADVHTLRTTLIIHFFPLSQSCQHALSTRPTPLRRLRFTPSMDIKEFRDEILGLVIYDLPGRDCAAKASNGELKVGEIGRYKTEYIDGTSDPGAAHSVLYSISSGIR